MQKKSPPFWRALFLVEKTKPDNTEECKHPVFPGDFFPFFIGPAAVGNGHFIDPGSQFGDFGRELGFKAEAVRFQLNLIEKLTSEHLVTDFHVRQIQIVQHIGKQRQKFVAQIVPEKEHPVGTAEKAGAIHDIGPVVHDRFQ